jgi:Spy/CpxP family protein refolding chaperone
MRKRTVGIALALAVLAAPTAAQVVPRGQMGRRAELQARVHERFMDQVAQRLGLDQGQRDRLSSVLRQTMEDRMALAQEGVRVRQHLFAAVQDTATSDQELQRLLDQLRDLRQREFELANREDAAMAEILTPRQAAQLLVLRARFNERVQEIRRQGPGRMMGPPPGGTGMAPPPPEDRGAERPWG